MQDNHASRRSAKWITLGLILLFAAGTAAVMWLWQNIGQRKEEGREHVFRVVELDEGVIDPAEWGKNYPRQYDSYRRTVDIVRTRHGGSDAIQKLDEDPHLRALFDGYAFAVDYREERGHAYMLLDQDMTERVKLFPQPGACLHCHSSVLPAYHQAGREAGIGDSQPREQLMKGFEVICSMSWREARPLVEHPVACIDCHDPQTLQLRVTRPGFLNGIQALATSDAELKHLPSIARWRSSSRDQPYDANQEASRQEMRSLVCAQCHVEYYFQGQGKLLTYPWHKGIKVEQIESYYDEVEHIDWKHARSGAPLLKAQHPEFELWSQGIHARSGVACADCHMPYVREGAIKVSSHHVRSPLLSIAQSCQTCHRYAEAEILARAETIQDRTKGLLERSEQAVVDLIAALEAIKEAAPPEKLASIQRLHRQAQWRVDFIAAENSLGFHASQETARILAEAIDLTRQGQVEAVKLQSGRQAE
jgi:nitrite reductase (cytochrome c-552)